MIGVNCPCCGQVLPHNERDDDPNRPGVWSDLPIGAELIDMHTARRIRLLSPMSGERGTWRFVSPKGGLDMRGQAKGGFLLVERFRVLLRRDGPPPIRKGRKHDLSRLATSDNACAYSNANWKCSLKIGHQSKHQAWAMAPLELVHEWSSPRPAKPSVADRFWSRVDKSGPVPDHVPVVGPCWVWIPKCSDRYPQFTLDGRQQPAHRVSWQLVNGPIPSGIHVLHKCDRTICVRPDHLFLGTHADNMADMKAKGRQVTPRGDRHGWRTKPDSIPRGDRSGARKHPDRVPRGERCGNAKLTDNAVREIRRLSNDDGLWPAELARRFGVSPQMITRVVRREAWKHVE